MATNEERRSAVMRAVKSKDTKPELIVRRLAYRLGYRFRLHRSDLPGVPDLTFPGRKKIIFVHGCFWHGHACARGGRKPKANADYWAAKIARNAARDRAHAERLQALGWSVLTLWECELRDAAQLGAALIGFLGHRAARQAASARGPVRPAHAAARPDLPIQRHPR